MRQERELRHLQRREQRESTEIHVVKKQKGKVNGRRRGPSWRSGRERRKGTVGRMFETKDNNAYKMPQGNPVLHANLKTHFKKKNKI